MSHLNSETWDLYHYIKKNKISKIDFPNGARLTITSFPDCYDHSQQPTCRLYIPKGESKIYKKDNLQYKGRLLDMLETLYLQAPQSFD